MKTFVIVVEGPEDEDFFRMVIKPYLEKTHRAAHIAFYLKTANKGWGGRDFKQVFEQYDHVLIVRDIDQYGCPAVLKDSFCRTYLNGLKKEHVSVVIAEIESWYIAVGGDGISWFPQRFKSPMSTSAITKENLLEAMRMSGKAGRMKKSAVLQQLINCRDIEVGKRRNESLDYFLRKVAGMILR